MAVFVKSASLTLANTRLAQDLGVGVAAEFQRRAALALDAVFKGAVAASGGSLEAYWAVAENREAAIASWPDFKQIRQGFGTVGTRIGKVYRKLRETHAGVLLVSADAPLVTVEDLLTAYGWIAQDKFVIGRTHSGGFNLFGGPMALEPAFWTSFPDSAPNTAEKLAEALVPYGVVYELDPIVEVDRRADLELLASAAASSTDSRLLPEQRSIIEWARQNMTDGNAIKT